MSLLASVQVVDLYIQQYTNGSITYIDANGQVYMPVESFITNEQSDSIINTSIDTERAIIFTVISFMLVLFGGITSGLNVSLLSIDAKKNKLMTKLAEKNSSLISESKIRMMETLQPLIDDKHLLLVTLLVANATCMEALPIFLDELVASWLAVIISVTFVLIFGEIVPQALFTADPLKSGYKLYYVVLIMKWVLFPICKPLAYILDLIFGEEHEKKGVVFTQKEINTIMGEISKHPDERTVVEGALKLADYTVMESIIPWSDVIAVDAKTKLDAAGLRAIYKTGFSRIPIYENGKENIVGILLVKTLILCDPDPDLTLKQYLTINFKKLLQPALVSPHKPLYDLLNLFQENKTHFAMVCDEKDEIEILECWRDGKSIPSNIKWKGIITLEDIMEDVIQEEIYDEFDVESPLQMLMEAASSRNIFKKHENWTDDQLFIESVQSRFNAKNKRTLRATQLKQMKKNKPHIYINDNDNVFQFVENKGESQSRSGLLTNPLLPNNASVNLKQ